MEGNNFLRILAVAVVIGIIYFSFVGNQKEYYSRLSSENKRIESLIGEQSKRDSLRRIKEDSLMAVNARRDSFQLEMLKKIKNDIKESMANAAMANSLNNDSTVKLFNKLFPVN